MKLKKILSYSNKRQIWRLLISKSNLLLVEERDTEKKEAYFNLVDIASGKVLWKNFQLDEKFWIGVEAIYNEVIVFHKFGKPDMPSHKEVIVYNLNDHSFIWKSDEYEFLFIHNDKIFCRIKGFEKHKFVTLNYLTGELIDDYGDDFLAVNEFKYASENSDKFAGYLYAEEFNIAPSLSENSKAIINSIIGKFDVAGKVEALKVEDLIFFNFHYKNNAALTNRFIVYDENKGKEIINEVLISSTNAFVPDSFFIKDDFLFILKEKASVLIFKIIK